MCPNGGKIICAELFEPFFAECNVAEVVSFQKLDRSIVFPPFNLILVFVRVRGGRISSFQRACGSRPPALLVKASGPPVVPPFSQAEHNLPLPPHLLNRPLLDAIKEELERLFLDKVLSNLGLCISIYDIRTIEGGFVFPGAGSSTYKVVFRLIMFRPYVGEILCGKLKASDANVSLGFFDDIKVPVHLLPHKSRMGEDGIWIWEHECGDLPMDLDEEVHFRVTKINYPPIPVEQDANASPFSPMEIIGEIYGDGLGLLSWWSD
ncbi:hypothetical protein C4D60_Mb01t16080 [Musa balbisiana]|uniref:DNA-directed RNA polymerase subunit n=1 Tax=Musa balbisiana TaxID=52838 RepID=A0A4S8JMZ0_MUSBA|nr:hypothetical protein C4D60_Mb01t16080 [Musa balbisiana]